MLIFFANPNATRVAGYNAWKSFNRFVRRGEHGIPILAPCTYTKGEGEEGQTKIFFKITYVFDISQTEGEPLPEPPDWKNPARLADLEARLIDFARSKNITVTIEKCGNAQGKSTGGAIVLDPTAGTATLIHELAHEILHRDNTRSQTDRQTREIEAESVAYVVASYFDLPQLESPNYLALWEANAEQITARLQRINRAAQEIINSVEPKTQEGEKSHE